MNTTSMEEKRTSFGICLLDHNGLGNRDVVVCYTEPSEKDIYKVEPQELGKRFKKRTNKDYEPYEGSQYEEGKPCEQDDLQQKDTPEEQNEEPTEDELSEGSIAWLSSESDNEDEHWSISAQSLQEEKKRRLLKILSFANHLSMRNQRSPLDQRLPYRCDSEDGTAIARTAPTSVNSTSMREQGTFDRQLDEDGSGSETGDKEQLYKREPMKEQQCATQPKKEGRPKGTPDEEGTSSKVEIRKREATEEHNEELTGDVPTKGCIARLSPGTNCELNCRSNSSISSSEKKRRSDPMSDAPAKKRLKQDTGEISLKDTQKSGSSGKRRLDKQGTDPEADGYNTAKKRKTGWVIDDDTQFKLLGPLKLPDLAKGVVSATEPDPHAVKLNSQLLEINRKLMFQEAIDDLAEDELSPSPPPIYNGTGIRVNTRGARLRQKLSDRRQKVVADLVRSDPIFKASPECKPRKLSKKLYIPVEQYPGYNFIGLILGPRGRTQKTMEKETGARIVLRGKGSCKSETEFPKEEDDLHVYLEADNQESLDGAVEIIEKILIPVEEGRNEHKLAQLRELAELTSSKIQRTVNKPNAICTVSGDAKNIRSPCPTFSTPEVCSHGGLFSSGGKGEEIDKTKLFVCSLPKSINDDGLRRLFVPFGPLCEAVVVKDKITGSSKSFGFVKYTSPRFAAEAMARMNGYRIDGKMIVVRVASRSQPTANVARNSRGVPGISMACAVMSNRDAVVCYKEPSEKDLYKVEPQELEKQSKKKTNKDCEPCEGSQCEEGKPCEQEDLQQKVPTEQQNEQPTEDELSEGSIAWLSSESDNEDEHWSISAQSISEEKKRRLLKILSFANYLSTRKQRSPLDPSSSYKCGSEDGTDISRTATTPFPNSTSTGEQRTFVCQLDEDGGGSETSEEEQFYKREPVEEQQCVTQPKKEERPPKGCPDEEGKPFVSSSEKKRLEQDTGEISLKDTQKSGSSGKRRLDKQETDPEADGYNTAKKRKTGWIIDGDTQLKLLGPLKLPDLIKGVVSATEPDPHAVKLNSQLLEINRKLMFQEAIDDLAEDELSPSPPPIYNGPGIRVNTRGARLRQKLSDRRQKVVADLVRSDPIFKASPENKPRKLSKKLYIPVEQYPGYNFIGLILGPRGRTQKAMEKETGARIVLRGKGSCKSETEFPEEDDDLHVYLEADSQESLDAAVEIIEKLLVPVEEGRNKHKHAQLRELAELTPFSAPEGCKGEEIDKAKLFVCSLPKSINDDGLRRLFVPFGPLCEAVVVKDKITGSSKSFGFVKYTSPRFAAEAMARMNGYRIDGRILVVRVASRSQPTANVARNSRGVPGISMRCAIMMNGNNSSVAWGYPSGLCRW